MTDTTLSAITGQPVINLNYGLQPLVLDKGKLNCSVRKAEGRIVFGRSVAWLPKGWD